MGVDYKVLMIGDVVGDSGLAAVASLLPALKAETGADLVVCNGENAAGGFGIVEENVAALLAAGVDAITSGNHVWEKKGAAELLDGEPRLLRPANYPSLAPGRGSIALEKGGASWLVVNLQGREGMGPIDSPFDRADAILAEAPAGSIVVVDFHAESFAEKEALALYLDGRVAALAGTHTHVQTADERILPRGAGYIGDLGMTGPVDSIIGVKAAGCLERNLSQMPIKMEVADGPSLLRGALFTIGADGRCLAIRRIVVGAGPSLPA